ncbi:MAG: CRISPR system precrRNA processing endoribonuclease RAMP protein Cas6 [bacterium]|nr:CRISPR system precrRNA processing endoribonuclease RAMP protein Cas6 [bacterium]
MTQTDHPMQHFTAAHFEFLCEAREHIAFGDQPGTAIRGALYKAMLDLFSPNDPIPGLPLDPVRELLASEDENNARGQDVPRAFSVQPPAGNTVTQGHRFKFGVSLYGDAQALIPYLFRAVPEMGNLGIGKGRGGFRLVSIAEFLPLNDSRRILMHHERVVPPRFAVTHRRVLEEVGLRSADEVALRFITPMRLIESGALVHTPKMGTLLRRLLERAQALVDLYGTYPDAKPSRLQWKDEWQRMGKLGDEIDGAGLLLDATRWVDIDSFSQKRGRSSPIGGIVGLARWRIHSPEVLAWLLWGQSLHVGKNAAKGGGYFRVE